MNSLLSPGTLTVPTQVASVSVQLMSHKYFRLFQIHRIQSLNSDSAAHFRCHCCSFTLLGSRWQAALAGRAACPGPAEAAFLFALAHPSPVCGAEQDRSETRGRESDPRGKEGFRQLCSQAVRANHAASG